MILVGLFYGDAVVCVEPTFCTAAVCGLLTFQRLTLSSQIKNCRILYKNILVFISRKDTKGLKKTRYTFFKSWLEYLVE